MGKGGKGFKVKTYKAPPEKFLVVVNPWGRRNTPNFANDVCAWMDVMLKQRYKDERVLCMHHQNTHPTIIVEFSESVKDISPFLGAHPYSSFLKEEAAESRSQTVAYIYEYNYERFDHPEHRNWKVTYPTYTSIPPGFPVRDPYPQPLGLPTPPPPTNVPYAKPVPPPAVFAPPIPPAPVPSDKPAFVPPPRSSTPQASTSRLSPPRRDSLRPRSPTPQAPYLHHGRSPSRFDSPQTGGPSSLQQSRSPALQASTQRKSPSRTYSPQPRGATPPARAPSPPGPHTSDPATSGFTPYVPPSHHPAHSTLTSARAQGHSKLGLSQDTVSPTVHQHKLDLDPYDEAENAEILLSALCGGSSEGKKMDVDPYEEDERTQRSLTRETTAQYQKVDVDPYDDEDIKQQSLTRESTAQHQKVDVDPYDEDENAARQLLWAPTSSNHTVGSPTITVKPEQVEGTLPEEEYEPSSELQDALAGLDDFLETDIAQDTPRNGVVVPRLDSQLPQVKEEPHDRHDRYFERDPRSYRSPQARWDPQDSRKRGREEEGRWRSPREDSDYDREKRARVKKENLD